MEWNRDDKSLIEKNTVKEMRRGKNFKNYKVAARRSFKKAIANSNASVSAQANPPEGLKNCHSTECLVCGKCDHSPTASWRVPSLVASFLATRQETMLSTAVCTTVGYPRQITTRIPSDAAGWNACTRGKFCRQHPVFDILKHAKETPFAASPLEPTRVTPCMLVYTYVSSGACCSGELGRTLVARTDWQLWAVASPHSAWNAHDRYSTSTKRKSTECRGGCYCPCLS